ncbi:hypothetical protein [Martelella sp. FOR1707]
MEMNDRELRDFIELVAASAVASKAVLTCSLAGMPVSRENCARIYGQWLDGSTPYFDSLVLAVDRHIEEMLTTGELMSPPQGSA